jgi:hypothetical protein
LALDLTAAAGSIGSASNEANATMPTSASAKAMAKTPALKRGSSGSLRGFLKRRTRPPG